MLIQKTSYEDKHILVNYSKEWNPRTSRQRPTAEVKFLIFPLRFPQIWWTDAAGEYSLAVHAYGRVPELVSGDEVLEVDATRGRANAPSFAPVSQPLVLHFVAFHADRRKL